jgi:hypothetical protein
MEQEMKISKKIFEKEISMCRELCRKKKGCQWGECKSCGVVPMLYKLYSGLAVEDKSDVLRLKKHLFEGNFGGN